MNEFKLLEDDEKIERWDIWFDATIPNWRPVSDDWVGQKVGNFFEPIVRKKLTDLP